MKVIHFGLYKRESLKKVTCLLGLEASKPQSRTAEINFGNISTIVYEGDLRPKLNVFDKMRNYDFFKYRGQ